MSPGDVGMAGVAVDSVEDMRVLFDGIPLDMGLGAAVGCAGFGGVGTKLLPSFHCHQSASVSPVLTTLQACTPFFQGAWAWLTWRSTQWRTCECFLSQCPRHGGGGGVRRGVCVCVNKTLAMLLLPSIGFCLSPVLTLFRPALHVSRGRGHGWRGSGFSGGHAGAV
jgi:hypothetical protein